MWDIKVYAQLNTGGASRNLAMAFAKESGQRKSGGGVIERVELPEKVENSRILILGGTGRVGGSTALSLSKFCPDLRIVIGGRNRDKGAAMVSKLRNGSEFSEVDIKDSESLDAALKDVDLVVHTAGPFQQAQNCAVLEAAVRNKVRKGNENVCSFKIQRSSMGKLYSCFSYYFLSLSWGKIDSIS